MFSKFVSKLIHSLPTWEVTKYYGRVCIYQLKCLKYKVQTSEAWFNLKCKFMPGSLRNELECEEMIPKKVKDDKSKVKDDQFAKQQKVPKKEVPVEPVACQKESQLPRSAPSFKDSNTYITDEFVTAAKAKKTQENKKYQEGEKYSMQDDYTKKKQRKVKQAQQ